MKEPQDAANNYKDEPENTIRYGFRSALSQVMVAVAQNFLLLAVGMSFGMPTVILGALDHKVATNQTRLESPDLIMNDEESSWLGSILFLIHPVGAVISGYLLEIVGRKKVMIIVCLPFFFGWMFLYYAESVSFIMMGTIAMGIGIGFCEGPIISYLGEVCEPRMRGALTLLTGVSGNLGILIIFFINALVDWRTTTLISSIIPILAMIMLLFLPESPTWLISKGRISEAEQALRWLRGWSKKDKVLLEFEQIIRDMSKSSKNLNGNDTKKVSKIEKLKGEFNYFRRPEVTRPFNMLMILFIVVVISSFAPMRPYLVEVFRTFGLPIDPEWVLVVTGVLQINGALVSSLTVNKFGKRPISLWSTAISFVASLLLSVCAMNLHWSGWISMTLFCMCFWISGFGLLTLPWMLMSEIFPIPIRGVACGICAALNSIICFLVTKTYTDTITWFGLHGTLFIYSLVSGLGFIYMYFCLPETEDRTLQEIIDFFVENRSAREFKRPKIKKKKSKEVDKVFTIVTE